MIKSSLSVMRSAGCCAVASLRDAQHRNATLPSATPHRNDLRNAPSGRLM